MDLYFDITAPFLACKLILTRKSVSKNLCGPLLNFIIRICPSGQKFGHSWYRLSQASQSFVSVTKDCIVCVPLFVHHRSVEDGPVSLSRCSCCEARSPSSWTSSSPTPRLTNICPSPAFSSDLNLCLAPLSGDWQEHPGSKPCHPYFLGNGAFYEYFKKREV